MGRVQRNLWKGLMDVPVELSRILITELGEQQVIFLKERNGPRNFPIMIGISEALAIDRRLKGIPTPRPMTHDLLAGVIEALGGELEKVVVNDLRDHTFIATLHIRRGEDLIEVDSRPSDAIALGAALETPLYVSERVFDTLKQSEPMTRKQRLELLRHRQDILQDQIAQLTSLLADSSYCESLDESELKQQQRQLAEMKLEYETIEELLRKYE